MNLDGLFGNTDIVARNGTDAYPFPLYTLDGLNYSFPGPDSRDPPYNASLTYTGVHVTLRPLHFNLTGDGNTGIASEVEVDFYGERDCRHRTHPWYGQSCVTGLSYGEVGKNGVQSVSLQPNERDNGTCLFFAKNGQNAASSFRSPLTDVSCGVVLFSIAVTACVF